HHGFVDKQQGLPPIEVWPPLVCLLRPTLPQGRVCCWQQDRCPLQKGEPAGRPFVPLPPPVHRVYSPGGVPEVSCPFPLDGTWSHRTSPRPPNRDSCAAPHRDRIPIADFLSLRM